jgi:Flp pilus assembly protein TadD
MLGILAWLLLAGPAQAQEPGAALRRAASLQQTGDLEGAVKAYREAIVLDPQSVEARSNLGVALAALGRYEEAKEAYREALRQAPGDPRIRLNLALAHYKSADVLAAAAELQSLHHEQPGELRTTLLLADCRLRLGEYEAVEVLLRPVELAQPDNRAVLYMLGMALIRNGKAEEGQLRVERLMRGGDTAEAQYLLGAASFLSGEYPRALQDFSKALALNPRLPSLRSYYGRALLFTGDADGAEQALREAVAADPNDYDANYFLASILATRQRTAEARPLAAHALELRPGSDDARTLLSSLQGLGRAAPGSETSPLLGATAPDVELRRPEGGTMRLSSLRGQPLLLVFGSYSCPQLRHAAPVLNRLYEILGKRVKFLLVYLREAHPQGESWPSTINEREGVSLAEALTESERAEHAALCRQRLSIPYEATIDGMDGLLETTFGAFPSRAFVLDRMGTVTFTTALSEESLRPQALEAALEAAAR